MKIAIVSSGFIHVDPRYLYLGRSLQQIGHQVIFLNIVVEKEQSQFFNQEKIKS